MTSKVKHKLKNSIETDFVSEKSSLSELFFDLDKKPNTNIISDSLDEVLSDDVNNFISTDSEISNLRKNLSEYHLRQTSIINRIETETRLLKPRIGKPKLRPPPLSKYRRRSANQRERTRMQDMNEAFESLRSVLPSDITLILSEKTSNSKIRSPKSKRQAKLAGECRQTKIHTLRFALKYISILRCILGYEKWNGNEDSAPLCIETVLTLLSRKNTTQLNNHTVEKTVLRRPSKKRANSKLDKLSHENNINRKRRCKYNKTLNNEHELKLNGIKETFICDTVNNNTINGTQDKNSNYLYSSNFFPEPLSRESSYDKSESSCVPFQSSPMNGVQQNYTSHLDSSNMTSSNQDQLFSTSSSFEENATSENSPSKYCLYNNNNSQLILPDFTDLRFYLDEGSLNSENFPGSAENYGFSCHNMYEQKHKTAQTNLFDEASMTSLLNIIDNQSISTELPYCLPESQNKQPSTQLAAPLNAYIHV